MIERPHSDAVPGPGSPPARPGPLARDRVERGVTLLVLIPNALFLIFQLTAFPGPPGWALTLVIRGHLAYPAVMALWWSGVGLLLAIYICGKFYPTASRGRIALLALALALLAAGFGAGAAWRHRYLPQPFVEFFRWDSIREVYTLDVSFDDRVIDPEISDRLHLVVLVQEIDWIRSEMTVVETTGPHRIPLSSLPIRVVDTWTSTAKLEPVEIRRERTADAERPRSIPQVRVWLESEDGIRVSDPTLHDSW